MPQDNYVGRYAKCDPDPAFNQILRGDELSAYEILSFML